MNEHTPGPWHVVELPWDDSGCMVFSGNGDPHSGIHIATTDEDVWADHESGDSGQSQANARLIAAAPDLLEACRKALSITELPSVYETLKAAIARAEGL